MGTFKYFAARTPNGCGSKVGGNVVAYFCTPDLTILHAAWGPETPQEFLEQAKFTVKLGEKLRTTPAHSRSAVARSAHDGNPYGIKGRWNGAGVAQEIRYRHLKEKVLQPLNKANTDDLFLKLVNEKIVEKDWMTDPGKARIYDLLGDWEVAIPSSPPRP